MEVNRRRKRSGGNGGKKNRFESNIENIRRGKRKRKIIYIII